MIELSFPLETRVESHRRGGMRKRISVLIGEEHREPLVKGPSWLSKLGTLSILYVSVFLTRIGFGSILIIFPIYLNIPASMSSLAGIVTALYPAVEGFSALPVGTFVDLRGRRRAFVAGRGMIFFLTLLLRPSHNLFFFVGGHAPVGFAAARGTLAPLPKFLQLNLHGERGGGQG